MNYVLTVDLISNWGDQQEICRFEYTIDLHSVADVGKSTFFYDAESKMYFEDKYALALVYQIDIQNIYLELPARLGKARDFVRRLSYINDWAEVKVRQNGKAVSIENVEELKSTWRRLKKLLTRDYVGAVVDNYMNEIELRLAAPTPFMDIAFCYHILGLILPGVPQKHRREWENKRIVTLSEYEPEHFEEHLVYKDTVDEMRHYDLSGALLPESKLKLEKYEGSVTVPVGELLPTESKVEVVYRHDAVTNSWNFRLEKY